MYPHETVKAYDEIGEKICTLAYNILHFLASPPATSLFFDC